MELKLGDMGRTKPAPGSKFNVVSCSGYGHMIESGLKLDLLDSV